jgi:hypothetical protein
MLPAAIFSDILRSPSKNEAITTLYQKQYVPFPPGTFPTKSRFQSNLGPSLTRSTSSSITFASLLLSQPPIHCANLNTAQETPPTQTRHTKQNVPPFNSPLHLPHPSTHNSIFINIPIPSRSSKAPRLRTSRIRASTARSVCIVCFPTYTRNDRSHGGYTCYFAD